MDKQTKLFRSRWLLLTLLSLLMTLGGRGTAWGATIQNTTPTYSVDFTDWDGNYSSGTSVQPALEHYGWTGTELTTWNFYNSASSSYYYGFFCNWYDGNPDATATLVSPQIAISGPTDVIKVNVYKRGSSYTSTFNVYISSDGATWGEAIGTISSSSISYSTPGETYTFPAGVSSGSYYVKLECKYICIRSFGVYGTFETEPTKMYADFAGADAQDWTSVSTDSYNSSWTINDGYASMNETSSWYQAALTSPAVTFSENETVYFELAKHSSSGTSQSITVQYSEDGNTWVNIGSAITDMTYNVWKNYSVNVPTASAKYIRFNGRDARIRNIYGGTLPAVPKNVAASNISATGATISWTAYNDETAWQVSYSETSGNPANGTIVDANSTSKVISGLTPETTYYVSVRIGNDGDWSNEISFTTGYGVPYSQTFGSSSIPSGWTKYSGNMDKVLTGTETLTAGGGNWNMANKGGISGYHPVMNLYSTYSGWLVTPAIELTTKNQVAFKLAYSAYNSTTAASNGTNNRFAVLVTTDNGENWTKLAEWNNAGGTDRNLSAVSTSGDDIALSLNAYSNSTVRIAFYAENSASGGDNDIHFDDVTISEVSDYSMAISGSDVSENTIAFGTVKNTTTTKTFTITNDGGNDLTNISVVSSDADVFTVSDTGFDLAAGATKDITVTFVKDAEANYSETITISQTNVSAKVLTVTATYQAPTPATMAAKLGEDAIAADGTSTFGFGTVGKAKSKTFTITNTGEATLNITSIESSNTTDFSVTPTSLDIPGGESGEFTVNFLWDGDALNAEKTTTITVTPSNAGLSTLSFKLTGTRDNLWSEDFEGENPLSNWKNNNWNIATNSNNTSNTTKEAVAPSSSSYGYLITPKLTATTGDILSLDAFFNWGDEVITVEYATTNDDAAVWTKIADYNYGGSSTSQVKVSRNIEITAPISGDFFLRFRARYSNSIDNLEGFKLCANDPRIAVYSDAEAAQAVTTGTAKDFGWVTEDATATYYIKNDGTGTLTINSISSVEGFTATTAGDVMTVAAGADPLALTVKMAAENNLGYHHGTITVTTDGGNFEIPVSGVMRDADKFYVDFSADDAKFPAGWSTGDWTVTNKTARSGQSYSQSSTTDIISTKLVAAPNEKLIIEALTDYSYYANLSYSYSTDNQETWSDAVSLKDDLTSSYKIFELTAPNTGAGDADVFVKFSGNYVSIRRIYGLTAATEPIMTTTAEDHDYGMQTAAADYEFTVSNEGTATLEGVKVALSSDDAADYEVVLSVPEGGTATIAENDVATIPAGQTLKVTATLKASTEYKEHTATLTISATSEGIAKKVITLKGKTRDAAKLYVDFDNPNAFPTGWTTGASWNVYSSGTDRYAYQSNYYTASALRMAPLTIAANETLHFQAGRYSQNTPAELKVRYTTDGGITWTENDYADQLTSDTYSTLADLTVTGIPAGTAVIEFYGRYVKLDNIYGGVATTAPLLEVTDASENVISSDAEAISFGENLQATPADKTFTLANKGNAEMTVAIAATGDVRVTPDGATIAAGESKTVTVSLPYDQENPGNKEGTVKITLNEKDFILNFSATTIDPTAFKQDFSGNAKPEGWYNGGWTFSDGAAVNSYSTSYDLITEKLEVKEGESLSYDAAACASWATESATLTVSYSTDRKNWTNAATQPTGLTEDAQTLTISGLAEGEYYVKFSGQYAKVDNLLGWHTTEAPAHDIYVVESNIPAETIVPGKDITATVTVASLRADETVTATLYFGTTLVKSESKTISNGSKEKIEITGAVPADEDTYQAYIKVETASDLTENTDETAVKVEHTRTLAIQSFARYQAEGEADEPEADANNQVTVAFDVTVKNTGTTAMTPIIKVMNGETVVGTATADAPLAVDATPETIRVTATDMSAGEGGELSFTAKAYWSSEEDATAFPYVTPVTITVKAAAPKFGLKVKDGESMTDGDAVEYGLVKEATTKQFTITNTGTKALVLTSIVASEGFEATEITDANKTIAIGETLDIDVTLKAEQGKKTGTAVITYDVNGTPATFTLKLSGRSISEDTWIEQFDASSVPATWTSEGGWEIREYNGSNTLSYTNTGDTAGKSIYTPRLKAAANEELTFDIALLGSATVKVEYSDDHQTWTEYETYNTAGEKTVSFTEAKESLYLRFTSNYARLDNFIGFKLNPLEHDMELTASDVPTTGKQYNTYTATVTLKENAGKDEAIIAELYVNDNKVTATADKTQADKNTSTVVTLTWEPQETITTAVEAYIKVTYAGGELTTTPVNLTISEVTAFNEDGSTTVTAIENETVMLTRSFVSGWNTICLPFEVAATKFDANAKAYEFTGYSDGKLQFNSVTTLSAGTPYLIHVTAANDGTEPIRIDNATISSLNTTAGTTYNSGVNFRGTYAPVNGSTLEGKYGVGSDNKLHKGSASATMKGFRAYFDGNLANARIAIYDDATGITTVYAPADLFGDQRVYDLKGQRVENAHKGVYIVNGKKVVMK